MARKTKADMIESYRQKIAELEAKDKEKTQAEAATAAETLVLCDASEAKAREAHAKAVATADETLAKKLERIEVRREKALLIMEQAAMDVTFSEIVLDEVGDDVDAEPVNA